MKSSKSIHYETILRSWGLLLLFTVLLTGLQAQTVTVSDQVKDITIPANGAVQNIYIEIKGGDGGNGHAGNCRGYGGAGATIKALYAVGTTDSALSPGGKLRFIRGFKGGSQSMSLQAGAGDAGGGGGGGSAVLYRGSDQDEWQILLAAGGGAGGYSGAFSWICTDEYGGQGGRVSTAGGDGYQHLLSGDSEVAGGTNGKAGDSIEALFNSSGGGAGAYSGSSRYNAEAGYPNGGAGGKVADGQSGGFGFGGGGASYFGPGGGGGYSGGGAGDVRSAGGGGSYVSATGLLGVRMMAGASGSGKNEDGYLHYQYNPDLADLEELMSRTIHSVREQQSTCINMENGATGDGTNIQLWYCDGTNGQKWLISDARIRSYQDATKCLETYKNYTANGTNAQLYHCNDSPGQKWVYDVYRNIIRSHNDFNKCLSLKDSDAHNGNNIHLWDCKDEDTNQQWIVDGVPSGMPTGTNKKIHLEKDNDKCIDLDSYNYTNGTNVRLYQCRTTSVQYFIFDNRYIRSQSAFDKCLSLEDSGDANGTNIHLWDCKGQDNQKWVYDGFAKAFRSVVNIDKCLSIQDTNAQDGTNIHLWDCKNNENQRFDLY